MAQATPGAPAGGATPTIETPAATAPVAPSPPADVPDETATVESFTYPARPVASTSGSAGWEDGFDTIQKAFKKIRAEMQTAGLQENGRPLVVFLETDDEGFKYDAMIPLSAPPAPAALGNGVKISATPTGKTLKFQHRGAYDDIDSTYEAITAYLDEKGLNAANVFIEEYMNDAQASDDNNLAVDIFVFLK